MSPEYNFHIKVNLAGQGEAKRFAGAIYENPAVVSVVLYRVGETLTKPNSPTELVIKGEVIRQGIHDLRLTQREFAIAVGVSEGTVSGIVKGRSPSSLETLGSIANVLGIKEEDPRFEVIMVDARVRHGRHIKSPQE